MVRFSPFARTAAPAVWILFALTMMASGAQDAAAPNTPLRRIAEIPVTAVEADDIFEAGGDILARHGDAYHALLTDEAYAQLRAAGVPMTVTVDDVDAAYRAYRAGLKRGRAEDFTDYHSNQQAISILERIAGQYPNLTTLQTIGESVEGRPIYALRVSEHPELADARPAILIMGCHHAREWISVEVPLYYADYLTEQFRRDGDVTRLLKRADVWIIPVVNPDGFEYSWTDDRWWRKNRSKSLYTVSSAYRESDGGQTRQFELSLHTDVAGLRYVVTVDGAQDDFTSEWFTDEKGDVKVVLSTAAGTFPPRFPPMDARVALMVNRQFIGTFAESGGVWSTSGEGVNAYGVDNNRNYGYQWGLSTGSSGNPRSETYRGPEAFSEPETRAIRDLMDRRAFLSAISYHNYSQLILYPNGYTTAPVANTRDYERLAQEMAALINDNHTDPRHDYGYGQGSLVLYSTSGDFTDWAHHVKGTLAYTFEVRPAGPPFFELPPNEIIPTCRENLPALLHLAHETLIPDARRADADNDGFLDDEDYCPNSPTPVVDEAGCDESEADLDRDGVLNAVDACRDTPPRQQVGEDGCRVTPMLTAKVSSNLPTAPVAVDPQDIDGVTGGTIGDEGLRLDYASAQTLILTAIANFNGNRFRYWVVDGTPQTPGQSRIVVLAEQDVEAEAVYALPQSLEIVGPRRVPHTDSSGFASLVPYSATVVFDDEVTEPANPQATSWRIEPAEVAAMDADGEMVVRYVTSDEGFVSATLTATTKVRDTELTSDPVEIRIYDPAKFAPACESLAIQGGASVASLATEAYTAFVTVSDGGTSPAQGVAWSVTPADSGADGVPASIDDDGVLSADWVASNTPVVIKATYSGDEGDACSTELRVTVLAGSEADRPAGRGIDSGGSICGAMSMVTLALILGVMPLLRRVRPF
ncbi:MAG: hypothetical protein C4547_04120 [Phycisphaerales bacterium]|nr:MAG: hypothetical protein C4547_04120 [Phycisphaerales bacterium]